METDEMDPNYLDSPSVRIALKRAREIVNDLTREQAFFVSLYFTCLLNDHSECRIRAKAKAIIESEEFS